MPEEIVGTGFTKVRRFRIGSESTPEEWEAYQEFSARTKNPIWCLKDLFDRTFAGLIEKCNELGVPKPQLVARLTKENDIWRAQEDREVGADQYNTKIYCGLGEIEDKFGYDSPEWYEHSFMMHWALFQLGGDVEDAMQAAMLYERFKWKFNWEDFALRGKKDLDDKSRGRSVSVKVRMKDAKRRERAIIKKAKVILEHEEALQKMWNASALADRILQDPPDELRKSDKQLFSHEMLRKVLGKARSDGRL